MTQTGDGPIPPDNSPITLGFLQSVPAAIIGTSTSSNGVTAGLVGTGLSTGFGVGVVAIGQSEAPAMIAFNTSTSKGGGLQASNNSTNGDSAISAEALSTGGSQSNGGPIALNAKIHSPYATGLSIQSDSNSSSVSLISTSITNGDNSTSAGFSVDGTGAVSANSLTVSGTAKVNSLNVTGTTSFNSLTLNGLTVNNNVGQFNNGLNVSGQTNLQNLQVTGTTSFNSLNLSGLTVSGGTGQFNNGLNVSNQTNLQNLTVNGNAQISGMGNGLTFPDGSTLTSAAGIVPVYNAYGTVQTAAHVVTGSATLTSTGSNPANSVTVMLSGAAMFSSATSYVCTVGTSGSGNTYGVSNIGGSAFTIGSSFSTVAPVSYICVGN